MYQALTTQQIQIFKHWSHLDFSRSPIAPCTESWYPHYTVGVPSDLHTVCWMSRNHVQHKSLVATFCTETVQSELQGRKWNIAKSPITADWKCATSTKNIVRLCYKNVCVQQKYHHNQFMMNWPPLQNRFEYACTPKDIRHYSLPFTVNTWLSVFSSRLGQQADKTVDSCLSTLLEVATW